ncbi:MAG: hypothetical protein IJ728_08925 [Selenomonadaceae bacterium]|nr:hypothetical protein [Selenomonadaceae bacterium]
MSHSGFTSNIYNDPTEKVLDKKDSGDSKIITIDGSKTTKGVEIVGYGNDTINDYSVDDGSLIMQNVECRMMN